MLRVYDPRDEDVDTSAVALLIDDDQRVYEIQAGTAFDVSDEEFECS